MRHAGALGCENADMSSVKSFEINDHRKSKDSLGRYIREGLVGPKASPVDAGVVDGHTVKIP